MSGDLDEWNTKRLLKFLWTIDFEQTTSMKRHFPNRLSIPPRSSTSAADSDNVLVPKRWEQADAYTDLYWYAQTLRAYRLNDSRRVIRTHMGIAVIESATEVGIRKALPQYKRLLWDYTLLSTIESRRPGCDACKSTSTSGVIHVLSYSET